MREQGMSFIPQAVEPKVYHGEIISPKKPLTPQEQAGRTRLIILEMNKILVEKPELTIHVNEPRPPWDEVFDAMIGALFEDYRKYIKHL